jgi:hypothetical protein
MDGPKIWVFTTHILPQIWVFTIHTNVSDRKDNPLKITVTEKCFYSKIESLNICFN